MTQSLIDVIAEAIYANMDRRYTFSKSHTQGQKDKFRAYAEDLAQSAVQAIEQAGYVCVKKYPDDDVLYAGAKCHDHWMGSDTIGGLNAIRNVKQIYAAMLSASKEE